MMRRWQQQEQEGPSRAWGHPGWSCSWPAALLAASILSSILPPQATGFSVSWEPTNLTERGSVTLTPGGTSENLISCSWSRGVVADPAKRIFIYYLPPSPHGQINGPTHTGRETRVQTCSLQISDLKLSDSGTYSVSKEFIGKVETGHATIDISEYVPNLNITGPNEGIEGTITVLNCTSKVAVVSYYWLKENRSPEVEGRIFLSNNNQTLTFNPILRSDIGDYTCYGDDRISKESATHQLVVLYGPDPPIISPSTRDYAEGSNLSLSCKAESNPPAQYLWFVDGNPKGSDSELLTINLSLNDAGNYICTAVNIKTKHNNSESLEIRVLQEVSDVTINGPSETIENTSVILTCTSRGSMVTYYWFKGKQSLKSEGHVSLSPPANQILIMNPVNRSDAGLYTCQGVNSISNDSSPSFPLEVFYGPDDPIISPPDQNYAEGSNLSLSCKATSNLPVEYTWLLNGTEEIFNETVGVGDASQLLIPDLSLKNSGTYSCHAFSNMTNITSYSDQPITVWEILSSPVLWPATSLVIENMKATLTCTTSDNTRVTISWFKEGQPLAANAGNNTLTFVNTAKDDTGIYTCEAKNLFSTGVSNPSNLIVAYGPDSAVLDQNGTIVLEPGSRLPLVCTADSSPVTRFRWFFNRIQQNMTGNHFTVDLTAGEGEGNYTCQASNPFTRLTASAAVHVKLASHKPTGLSVGAIAGIVLGVVAVMALIGTLLYFLFRPRQQQRDQTSQPGISAPSLYEDIASSMVDRPNISTDRKHVYENPQREDQSMYDSLRW